MIIHDDLELIAHNGTYYDYSVDGQVELDFAEICQASLEEDMNPLSESEMKKYLFGIAMLGNLSLPHKFEHTEVVASASVTAIEKYKGVNFAIVGGVITLPRFRGQGYGLKVVERLCEVATYEDVIAQHGYQGLLARCNDDSKKIFEKLNFIPEPLKERNKTIMLKMF